MARCMFRFVKNYGHRFVLLILGLSIFNSLVLLIWTNSLPSYSVTWSRERRFPWQQIPDLTTLQRELPTARNIVANEIHKLTVPNDPQNNVEPKVSKTKIDFEFTVKNYSHFINQNNDYFIINPAKRCEEKDIVKLLVLVVSLPNEGALRKSIRETWTANLTSVEPSTVVLFVLGMSRDVKTQNQVIAEGQEYGDVIQGDFIDSKDNETLRTMSVFHWVTRHCVKSEFLLKTDVRSIVIPKNLLDFLSHAPKTNFAAGRALFGTQPVRNSKSRWYVSRDEWARTTYPSYMEGPSYVLSSDVVQRISSETLKVDTFRYEDVYVGILLDSLKIGITDTRTFDIHGSQRKMCDLRNVILSGKFSENEDMLERYWRGLGTLDGALCERTKSEWSAISAAQLRNSSRIVNYLNYSFPITHPSICTLDDNPEKFGQEVFLLLITPSSATKRKERDVIRNTRGKRSEFLGQPIVQVFLVGRTTSESLNKDIHEENNKYGDIVMVDIDDNYQNLTLKSVMLFKWASIYCPNAKYVMKVDDDVFINLHNLISLLIASPRTRFVLAYVHEKTKPLRDPKYKKWFVTKDEWQYDTYPPYPNGPGYVMSYDVVRDAFLTAHMVKLFRFEDVNFGIILQHMGVHPTHHAGFDSFGKKRTLCELKEAMTSHWVHEDNMYKFWRELEEWGEFVVCDDVIPSDLENVDKIVIDQGRVFGLKMKPDGTIPSLTIDHPEKCNFADLTTTDISIIVCVMTSPSNFNIRKAIRETWGMYGREIPNAKIETLYFVGRPNNEIVQRKIEAENKNYGDIIQYNFLESYEHLVLKTLAMMQWVSNRCSHANYFVKVDDDVFLNYANLVEFLISAPRERLYLGEVRIGTGPSHTQTYKWYTPKEIYPGSKYPPYISGPSYVMSVDVAVGANKLTDEVRIFKWEDVYIGSLIERLGVAPYPHTHYDLYGIYRTACTLQAAIASHHFTIEMYRKYWNLIQGDIQKDDCKGPYLEKVKPKFEYSPQQPNNYIVRGKDDIIAHEHFWTSHPHCQYYEARDSPIFLVILVMTSAANYDNRRYSRFSWANQEMVLGRRVVVKFVSRDPVRPSYHKTLLHEDELYRDILLSRINTKGNITIQTLHAFKWLTDHCQSAQYVMKVADDVFVNIERVVDHLIEAPSYDYTTGSVLTGMRPVRDHKSAWYVPQDVWPENAYPPYCTNDFLIMSMDVVEKLVKVSHPSNIINIPDVYIGIALHKLGIKPVHSKAFDSKGLSATGDKNGVCGLHSVMAAKGFTGQTMLYISRNILDGTFMNCDLNDMEGIADTFLPPINPPSRAIDTTLNGIFSNRTIINKHNHLITINHPGRCARHGGDLALFVLIITSPNEESFRNAIRSSWASDHKMAGVVVDYVFLLGMPSNSETHYTQNLLIEENAKYEDMIQEDFIDVDNFYNQTLKTIMALKWATEYCQNAKYLVKTKVTTYMQTTNIVNFLKTSFLKETDFVIGHVLQESKPIRNPNSTYYTPKSVYPDDRYPSYPEGRGYVISSDVAYKLYVASLYVALFPWEDVYIGLLLKELSIVPRRHSDFLIYPVSGVPDVCYMRNSFTWNVNSPRAISECYFKLQASLNETCFEKNLVKPNDYDFLIKNDNICQNVTSNIDLVVIVMTSAANFGRRRAIRETWTLQREWGDFRLTNVFMVGKTHDHDVQSKLLSEHNYYGDIVQCSFHDTYGNLTLKTVMMLKWVNKFCPKANYVMKVDDDVFINIENVIASLHEAPEKEYSWGRTYYFQSPVRNPKHKNYTPLELWPERPFPPYNAGPCYVMSADVADTLYRASFDSKRFVNEDVFMGVLLQKTGVYPIRDTRFDIAGAFRSLCEFRKVIASHKVQAHDLYKFWYRLYAEKDLLCDKNDQPIRNISLPSINVIPSLSKSLRFTTDRGDFCDEMRTPNSILLVLLVASFPANINERNAIRKTWGRTYQDQGFKIVPLFFIGSTTNLTAMKMVQNEAGTFRDIIQADFQDGTYNATLKTLVMIQWAAENCHSATFIMKTDDGTFVQYHNVIRYLQDAAPRTNLIAGRVLRGTGPNRDPKSDYYTPESIYPKSVFPTYVEGPTYIMSIDVVRNLNTVINTTKLIIWEDVHVGLLLEKINVTPTDVPGFDLDAKARGRCEYRDSIVTRFLTAPQIYRFWQESRYNTIFC